MTKRDYLGNFELMVMLALLRLGEDAYGVSAPVKNGAILAGAGRGQ